MRTAPIWHLVPLLAGVVLMVGCEYYDDGVPRYEDEQSIRVDVDGDRHPADATPRVDVDIDRGDTVIPADDDGAAIDVDVSREQGVDVDIDGEAIRERIEERREARHAEETP